MFQNGANIKALSSKDQQWHGGTIFNLSDNSHMFNIEYKVPKLKKEKLDSL